jgi:hypothetical protein
MADSYFSKADADGHSRTYSRRSRTTRTALERLIIDMLPTHGPGMSPAEVTERLKEDSPAHKDGLSSESLKTQVRTILREMCELEKVSRVPAQGSNAGFSHRYVRHDSAEADVDATPKKSLIVVLRLRRSAATFDSGRQVVDLLVNRVIKVNREPGKQDTTDDVRMDIDFQFSTLV